jgi:hypothetical protein
MARVSAEYRICRRCRRAKRIEQLERRGRHYYRCADPSQCVKAESR